MEDTLSIQTVSSSSRRSSDDWSNWGSDSTRGANEGFKGDTESGSYVDAIDCSHGHHNSSQTEEDEVGHKSLKASPISISSASASEIKPLSKNSLKRRYERKLFERRPELNGPMMRRKRGYEKPVEKCGLFFGNRQGSIDCSPSAAPVTQDETTAITGQPSSVMTAPPAKPYIGNYSRRLVEPFTVISDSQITSLQPQFLRVPSRPPLELCEDPKASCEASRSSQRGRQAESIKTSWYESGTAFLGKAVRSCYTASKSKYDQAASWCKQGLALAEFRKTAMHSALGSYIRDLTETKIAKVSIGATAMARSGRPNPPWTQCTGTDYWRRSPYGRG